MKFFTMLAFVFGVLAFLVAVCSSHSRLQYNKNELYVMLDSMRGGHTNMAA